jgi:hypothetical protein
MAKIPYKLNLAKPKLSPAFIPFPKIYYYTFSSFLENEANKNLSFPNLFTGLILVTLHLSIKNILKLVSCVEPMLLSLQVKGPDRQKLVSIYKKSYYKSGN